jgi:hypothetical protein
MEIDSNTLLFESIISTGKFTTNQIYINENIKPSNSLNLEQQNSITIEPKNILEVFELSNQINEFNCEKLGSSTIDQINHLIELGIEFEFKNQPNKIFEIQSNEIVFPICCQGKNRSQFMFVYLKYLQNLISWIDIDIDIDNNFFVGYPASGDEMINLLNDLNDNNSNDTNSNQNSCILSGFNPSYKSDGFSECVEKIFGIKTSRSVHVFSKILKNKSDYTSNDIKNLEQNKYIINKHDIFNIETQKNIIKKLYETWYFNQNNLIDIVEKTNLIKISKITWICLSDKSYINLISLLYFYSKNNSDLKFDKIRIIYFGINDIFQGKNIKSNLLDNFVKKIYNSFKIKII